MRAIVGVILRDVATQGALLDVLRGEPVVYADYLAYDECAHRRGPDSRMALYNLRGIDEGIDHVLAAAAAVPEHRYDVLVLSDHGQSSSVPFQITEGEDLAELVLRHAWAERGAALESRAVRDLVQLRSLRSWAHAQRRPLRLAVEPYLAHLERRAEAKLRARASTDAPREVQVVTGGTIAHVYLDGRRAPLLLDEIERRWPELVRALIACRSVGMLLARGRAGPVIFFRGRRYPLADRGALEQLAPFRALGWPLAAHHLGQAVASPRSGDLILYGAFAEAGNVAFDFELGSHGGLHPDELDCFLLRPPGLALPLDGPAAGTVRAEQLHALLRARLAEPVRADHAA
jgi:hypothetical protein